MNNNFTRIILTISLIIFSLWASAQNPIWEEDFSDGNIPANWTTFDASGQISYGFEWTQEGYYFSTQPFFTAATASNGYMFFNSDSLGFLSMPHDIRLTTDAIDCSSLSTVQLTFSNQYAYFSSGNVSIPELGVSTDGTNFTYFPILQNVSRNDLSNSLTIQNLNISNVAAGQSTVYLQFRWRGNFEYSWRIDDVKLGALLNNDVAILENTYAGATSAVMPVSQMDSLRFSASLANLGAATQNNVTLEVSVKNNSMNTIVHTQSHNFGTILTGDTIHNFQFPLSFLPDENPELYTISYNLSIPSMTDNNPANNTFSVNFETTTDEFMKVASSNLGITPEVDNNWTVGTQFYVQKGSDFANIRYANAIKFGITNTATANNILGFPVQVLLEKGVDNNNNGLIETSERTLVASGTHTFSAADVGIIVDVPIANSAGNLYELENNTSYLVSVKYVATATENMFLLMSDEISFDAANVAAAINGQKRYSHYLDIGNSGIYDYTINFTDNPIPMIGLLTSTIGITSTNSETLLNNSLKVFPNPTTEFITASIDLEKISTNAQISIHNLQGQVLETRNLSNVKNEQVRFNLTKYAAGLYFISINTDFGNEVKRFTVKK